MVRMTLQEAIDHALRVANSYKDTVPDCDCAEHHRQLAGWLMELKDRRQAENLEFNSKVIIKRDMEMCNIGTDWLERINNNKEENI